jgi:hypothetical protein
MPPLYVLPFPDIDAVAFSIGPLAVRWYALAYVFGLLLALAYAKRLVPPPRTLGSHRPAGDAAAARRFPAVGHIGRRGRRPARLCAVL